MAAVVKCEDISKRYEKKRYMRATMEVKCFNGKKRWFRFRHEHRKEPRIFEIEIHGSEGEQAYFKCACGKEIELPELSRIHVEHIGPSNEIDHPDGHIVSNIKARYFDDK